TFAGGEELHNIDFSLYSPALFSVSGAMQLPDAKAGFWLALSSPEQPDLAIAVAQTEKDGKFTFSGIPPGSYNLLAIKTGGARNNRGALPDPDTMYARSTIQVAGQNIENLSLVPESGRTATFTLKRDNAQVCPASAQLILTSLEDWGANLEKR